MSFKILKNYMGSLQLKRKHGCQEERYTLGLVCFLETGFRETIFQTFLWLFVIRKVGQRKTLSGQRKILSSQRKTVSGQRKILSGQF